MISDEHKYWIQWRSKNKLTFSDILDSTAADNLILTEISLNSMMREADEEAEISETYIWANIKVCRTVFYHMSKCNNSQSDSSLHV